MRNTLRRLASLLVAATVLFALPLLGCMEESPYYEPQPYPNNGPGPSGTSAFVSGEASKTGLSPVKEGARDAYTPTDAAAETVEDEEPVDDGNTDSTPLFPDDPTPEPEGA